MTRDQWENYSCSCHINPPCTKCMETCGDCEGFFDANEKGECENCAEIKRETDDNP